MGDGTKVPRVFFHGILRTSHYIQVGGAFDQACPEWLKVNTGILDQDRAADNDETRVSSLSV